MNETTEKRKTSAELKKEIEQATTAARESKTKAELIQSGLPITAIADRINGNSTTDVPKTESKSEPAATTQPATEKATAPKESVELQEWKKKKGINWDTPDSVAIELRKLDQDFHRKRAEELKNGSVERPPQGWTQTPSYQPPPPMNPYPSYVQPVPNQRQVVEQLARQYNMVPEDVERMAMFNRDMFNSLMETERQRHMKEIEDMKRENIKNSEFRELSADPVFRRPEVAKEFHEVIENIQSSDPASFSQDPYVYRKAFDRALTNIARRNLEGTVYQESAFQLPNTPPRPLGTGAGGGRETNENGITQAEFDRLSVEDKRQVLSKMGLVQSKY